MTLCVDCGITTHRKDAYVCMTCHRSLKVPCGCGCGLPMQKYVQGHGIRLSKTLIGHQNLRKAVYMSNTERKHRRRSYLIEYRGGKCVSCGLKYNGKNACVFDFHHRDPDCKELGIHGCDRSLKVLIPESDKCDVLCSNCHRMHHAEEY
jgi:hypothetical protein